MTNQRIALDDLTSDQLDRLYDRAEGAEAARDRNGRSRDRQVARAKQAEARAATLEQRVAELTAGQCTHALAVCQQHHRVPVDGCPYPRCIAARTQEADL